MVTFGSGCKVKVYLCVFPVPRVGHGVRRRQRLVRPHRVCGARRPRLQHDTPSYGSGRSPQPPSLIHCDQHRDHCTAPHSLHFRKMRPNRSIHDAVSPQNLNDCLLQDVRKVRKPMRHQRSFALFHYLGLPNIHYSIRIIYNVILYINYYIFGRIFTQFVLN